MLALFSIKPEYAFKLLSGSKLYEYRRAIFRRPDVARIIIYASSPVMRIVGELEVASVLDGSPYRIWRNTSANSGISRTFFFDYFDGREVAYAIHVKKALTYRNAVDPKICFSGFRPPQSFQYLEEDQLQVIRNIAAQEPLCSGSDEPKVSRAPVRLRTYAARGIPHSMTLCAAPT